MRRLRRLSYHGRVSEPPLFTQNTLRNGVVEFAFGEPDPTLLPVGLVRDAAARALGAQGAGALAYGANEGPEELRAAIAERSAASKGMPSPPATSSSPAATRRRSTR